MKHVSTYKMEGTNKTARTITKKADKSIFCQLFLFNYLKIRPIYFRAKILFTKGIFDNGMSRFTISAKNAINKPVFNA